MGDDIHPIRSDKKLVSFVRKKIKLEEWIHEIYDSLVILLTIWYNNWNISIIYYIIKISGISILFICTQNENKNIKY